MRLIIAIAEWRFIETMDWIEFLNASFEDAIMDDYKNLAGSYNNLKKITLPLRAK